MRTLRVLVTGVLIAGGLAALAPAATASVPGASTSCKSLTALDTKLQNVLKSDKVDTGAIGSLSSSFRNGSKSFATT